MNDVIIKEISEELKIKESQTKIVLELLSDGNTIPFIARYRKDATGSLDEEQIKKINEVYEYQVNLLKRKEDVIRLIDEKDLLTDELREKIMSATKLVEVEDLYRPYKEKKKTKATEAIKNGLEPLAKIIMSFPEKGNLDQISEKYVNDNVKTKEDAIMGAKYIIAEWISDNASYRKWIRNYVYRNGILSTKVKKDNPDDKKVYEMYYSYSEKIDSIKPHRVLAINRAESEKVITVSCDVEIEKIAEYLESKVIKNSNSFVLDTVRDAINDSIKRLIYPSIEREIRSDLTEKADIAAIENFSKNLENLLLQPPMKEKTVLAFDPGFTNGCKLAVIDKTGKYLTSCVIKPFTKGEEEKSKIVVKALIQEYDVDIIAIGNGTASRESESFIASIIKEIPKKVEYIIVSEAGASIYSTEKVAKEEFPDLSPNERSAVSIGRRLQDPLSELVKIPPSGIGVGLYQHDVAQNKLKENLDFVVSKAVNSVGVNVNTASSSLLKYVSGLTSKSIEKIIKYRNDNGKILSREDLKKILTSKTFEQSIGFLRIVDGKFILDQTAIHPESYDDTIKLLKSINLSMDEIGTAKALEKLNNIDIKKSSEELKIEYYTLEDIVKCLKNPTRDPRDDMPRPLLKSDILHIEDLRVGMKLQGTVRNVVDFGAFIDIGLHDDGLAHISKLSDKYIKHPMEVVNVGDIVDCYVDDINLDKQKVSLSLLKPNN